MRREPILIGPETFCFLNEERRVCAAADWNDPQTKKLWLYNLHYFDDLNARDAEERTDWHRALIKRWIAENPPGRGNGWEPYPTSLRIVNWVKWALRGHELDRAALQSLAMQARWLRCHLEYHLLGNHLLANAKALVFAGTFFDGAEADEWSRKGTHLLARELQEQVLGDGGHFELSPMYHLIILEDLLDLINLERLAGRRPPRAWSDAVQKMLGWAAVMRHPDGNVPFFNDAALGIAPTPAELNAYARQLGFVVDSSEPSSTFLSESGYAKVCRGPAELFVDVAKVGPDYLPGHAHADSLSFELSLGGQRVCVNAGTSTYEADELRAWQRGTGAHNTVRVDGMDSSEMWAAFRVARRAIVSVHTMELENPEATITASHDGFRRVSGGAQHQRSYQLSERALTVQDEVNGRGQHEIETFLHFHPEIQVVRVEEKTAELRLRGTGERLAKVAFRGDGTLEIQEGCWYPEFGREVPNQRCVFIQCQARLPSPSGFTIDWSDTSIEY